MAIVIFLVVMLRTHTLPCTDVSCVLLLTSLPHLLYSLPIVQGGSFSYLPATFQIIFNAELQAIEDPSERFERTMRTIQGAVIISGICQIVIGYSGMITLFLRFISPVTIAPVIAAIGLGLYGVGFTGVSACWSLGLMQLGTIVVFSQ